MKQIRTILRLKHWAVIAGGAFVLPDAGMVAWGPGELVTGYQNGHDQAALAQQLQAPPPAKAATKPLPRLREDLPRLRKGQAVGRLRGPHIKAIVVQGRSQSSIDKGPGMWGAQPGEGKTVVISGHRVMHGSAFPAHRSDA